MEAPVLHYRFLLDDPDQPVGAWAESGDHHIWHARFEPGHRPLEMWQRRKQGFVRLPVRNHSLNMIEAGIPYHIEHLFGFWRISEADTIWLRSVQNDATIYAMVVGGQAGAQGREDVLWCCPGCGAELQRHEFDIGDRGAAAFWKAQLAHVRAFNADVGARTCSGCGEVHPGAYGFYPDDDDATEAAARRDGWHG